MAASSKVAEAAKVEERSGDDRPRVGSALDAVNDGFHEAYYGAREEAKLDAPVFVVHADELFVFRHGGRRVLALTPRIFHVIKSAAHAPVALFAAVHRTPSGRVPALRKHVIASLASLDDEREVEPETLDAIRTVLDATLAFMNRFLQPDAPGARGEPSADLDAFARAVGKQLLHLTTLATRVQLAALHEAVEEALGELDPHERRELQVVVTGDHQPRVRSLEMQYFRKRFGEPDGAEERVTYAEGVEDVDGALALVGTRRLDAAIAKAFFGDAKRLQRDVLGDAAHALLASTQLAPIG